jgi:hypothetical protein
MRALRILTAACALCALGWAGQGRAQDMEARAYSAAPVGTNFALGGLLHSYGGASLDPSLPITNVNARIDTWVAGYSHSFGLAGNLASLGLVVPYVRANVTGDVGESSRGVHRAGLADVRMRFATNLIGNPAVTPAEFAQRAPTTVLGISLSVVAPTGQYDSSKLINIGANRWAFKPEIGLSQPIGNWFVDLAAGVWLFSENHDFFHGHTRSQDPIYSYQTHIGYNFRPGLWLAADATYWDGGETTLNGVAKHDLQENSRYGMTLSVPFGEGWSAKLAWSNGLATRIGSDFHTYTFFVQYRWFDR